MLICMRTTIQMDPHLLKAAKKYAAEHRRTLTSVIEDAIREVLARATSPRPSINLPISKVGGGFQPGIDPRRMADFYELEDLEYMERRRGPR